MPYGFTSPLDGTVEPNTFTCVKLPMNEPPADAVADPAAMQMTGTATIASLLRMRLLGTTKPPGRRTTLRNRL
jgi:hypothetical protein